jgi:hypothetical protein
LLCHRGGHEAHAAWPSLLQECPSCMSSKRWAQREARMASLPGDRSIGRYDCRVARYVYTCNDAAARYQAQRACRAVRLRLPRSCRDEISRVCAPKHPHVHGSYMHGCIKAKPNEFKRGPPGTTGVKGTSLWQQPQPQLCAVWIQQYSSGRGGGHECNQDKIWATNSAQQYLHLSLRYMLRPRTYGLSPTRWQQLKTPNKHSLSGCNAPPWSGGQPPRTRLLKWC